MSISWRNDNDRMRIIDNHRNLKLTSLLTDVLVSVLTETLVAPLALAVNSSCWTISTENFAGPPPEAVADELAVVVVVHWILAAGGPSPDDDEE